MQGVPPAGYKDLTALLASDKPTTLRSAVMARGVAAGDLRRGVSRGRAEAACGVGIEARQCALCVPRRSCEFARRGGHGLLPDLLPGYVPVTAPGAFAEEYAGMPQTAGLTTPEMLEAARGGRLGALLVVGANPLAERRSGGR